jgi:peptide/nickel transport system substrate-binding protein
MRRLVVVLGVLLVGLFGVVDASRAQEKPRTGGELIFVVPSEPPTYDGHAEGTFGLVHPLAPHYNGLLRIDPFDRTGTSRWRISPNRGRSRAMGLPTR